MAIIVRTNPDKELQDQAFILKGRESTLYQVLQGRCLLPSEHSRTGF